MGALLYVAHHDYVQPPGPRDPAIVDALQRTIADLEEIQRELGVMSFDTGFPIDFGLVRQALGPEVTINGGPHVELLRQGPA